VLAYWESLVDKHDLRRDVILDTEYVGSEWISSEQHHAISFRRSDGSTFEYSANVIISANGPLSKPTIPKLPGLENFEGVYFHNLHWDESVDLSNKRVAVIGNGSSGIQLVVSAKSDRWAALQLTEIIEQPGVADIPGVQLTHFIRSGGYFVPKGEWTRD
jgi:cation diffusion facilitator CzcD-associated flavoprotein CzcO